MLNLLTSQNQQNVFTTRDHFISSRDSTRSNCVIIKYHIVHVIDNIILLTYSRKTKIKQRRKSNTGMCRKKRLNRPTLNNAFLNNSNTSPIHLQQNMCSDVLNQTLAHTRSNYLEMSSASNVEYGWNMAYFSLASKVKLEIYVLFYFVSLSFIFWLSMKISRVWKLFFFPMAAATISIGVLIVVILKELGHIDDDVFVGFNSDLFYYALLPPIIFSSGVQLNHKLFKSNFTVIMLYANLGTVVSTLIIGLCLFLVGRAHLSANITLMECLTFGSLV